MGVFGKIMDSLRLSDNEDDITSWMTIMKMRNRRRKAFSVKKIKSWMMIMAMTSRTSQCPSQDF